MKQSDAWIFFLNVILITLRAIKSNDFKQVYVKYNFSLRDFFSENSKPNIEVAEEWLLHSASD